MNDWGLVFIVVFGLLLSVSFIVNTIIDPFLKKRKGEKASYNKVKIILTLVFTFYFVIFATLVFSGVIDFMDC